MYVYMRVCVCMYACVCTNVYMHIILYLFIILIENVVLLGRGGRAFMDVLNFQCLKIQATLVSVAKTTSLKTLNDFRPTAQPLSFIFTLRAPTHMLDYCSLIALQPSTLFRLICLSRNLPFSLDNSIVGWILRLSHEQDSKT